MKCIFRYIMLNDLYTASVGAGECRAAADAKRWAWKFRSPVFSRTAPRNAFTTFEIIVHSVVGIKNKCTFRYIMLNNL